MFYIIRHISIFIFEITNCDLKRIVVILRTKVVLLAFKPLSHNPFLWKERKINSIIAMIVLLLIASLVVPYLPLYHSTLPHPERNIPCGADLLLPYIVNMVYRNLKADKIRKRISHYFVLQPIVLESWITSLTLLRKACCQVGSCMDFVFTYTKVYFLATHLRNTLLCQRLFSFKLYLPF